MEVGNITTAYQWNSTTNIC